MKLVRKARHDISKADSRVAATTDRKEAVVDTSGTLMVNPFRLRRCDHLESSSKAEIPTSCQHADAWIVTSSEVRRVFRAAPKSHGQDEQAAALDSRHSQTAPEIFGAWYAGIALPV